MSDYLYETENYFVTETDNAIGEDGNYGQAGYAVVNKDTGIIEHTTIMLPGAIFQSQHFSDTLKGLLETPDNNVVNLAEVPTEDVVPN